MIRLTLASKGKGSLESFRRDSLFLCCIKEVRRVSYVWYIDIDNDLTFADEFPYDRADCSGYMSHRISERFVDIVRFLDLYDVFCEVSHTEVSNSKSKRAVRILVDENVPSVEIRVDDSEIMHFSDEFRDVSDLFLVENVSVLEIIAQRSSVVVFQNEI